MTINIRDFSANNCECFIIDIEDNEISNGLLFQLKKEIKAQNKRKRVALNLANLSVINNEFLESLEELSNSGIKLSLFNLSLNVYLLLFIMKYDKFADLFVSEPDFLQNQRNIVNRQFKLLKAV